MIEGSFCNMCLDGLACFARIPPAAIELLVCNYLYSLVHCLLTKEMK